jgi:two-component system, LytTR family, response regulator AlgR
MVAATRECKPMPLKVLMVDDEALARQRLRTLLAECGEPVAAPVGEAATAAQALERLAQQDWDVVLLDIHMPGMDGVGLAQRLRAMPRPPAIVFVTAHPEHALAAFELEAVDYLTKPVRRERLQQALAKSERWQAVRADPAGPGPAEFLLIHDRGRTERVPLEAVVYLKAELKYVTVRTGERSHIFDGTLQELEQAHPQRWLRVHRNALVARRAVRALERVHDQQEGEGWVLQLDGIDERLAVSRRQLSAVREALAQG